MLAAQTTGGDKDVAVPIDTRFMDPQPARQRTVPPQEP
jgi:hypothetical protein